MTKVKHQKLAFIITLLIGFAAKAQTGYSVSYRLADSAQVLSAAFDTAFASRLVAQTYIQKLPATLQSRGYITASVDSVQYDSLVATVTLYLGEQYKWAKVLTQPSDEELLSALRWNGKQFTNTGLNFASLQAWQERILNHLEETGYPFAKVYLDSIALHNSEVQGLLKIDRGPLYTIDSIRVHGDVKISNEFLQRYLDIYNGSTYNKRKLQGVNQRLAGLTYVQEEYPATLTMLGSGSVLNLYLKPKKTSQVNLLLGFLPNSDATEENKFQFTIDANILLRNALGSGETIGLTWQKLQPQSQRLNLLYDHPFIFKSPLGLSFNFDMFRKDSTFLNINMRLGTTYQLGTTQAATVFLQRRQSIVNGVDVARVLQTRRLPDEADVSSLNLGVTYEYNTTNYRFNPQRGYDIAITTTAGQKNLKKSNQVVALKDPGNPSFKFESLYDTVKMETYQVRIVAAAAKYFSVGKQSAVKTGVNAGYFGSGNIFRNELFQIGGNRLLRGFDEESQYVSQYAIGTLEYRYLIGQNSNFFAFVDGGWAKHLDAGRTNHTYIGTGLGIAFETKAGVFNLVWALGKRDDTEFNLRQSKVHLGFVSFF